MMVGANLAVLIFWRAAIVDHGSLKAALAGIRQLTQPGAWPLPSARAVGVILAFAAIQALLTIVVPGRTALGPLTPCGQRQTYKINGLAVWLITIAAYWLFGIQLGLFPAAWVYDNLGSILATCSLLGLIFCIFLYLKGVLRPSSPDFGRSRNPLFDYFWGVELHPSLGPIELKHFVVSKLGMMCWGIIVLSCLAKQYQLQQHLNSSLLLSAILQLAYIAKFYMWERGYLGTLDMAHDRAGFYLCWASITWLPIVYTMPAIYLAEHPVELPPAIFVVLLVLGVAAIAGTYNADRQRFWLRESSGMARVWGKPPVLIAAKYHDAQGQERNSQLLASGWWGVARHFNYVLEIAGALAWTLPCGFRQLLPYIYVVYLAAMLLQRSFRDEARCREKYGSYWTEYCRRVPYRLLPGVF